MFGGQITMDPRPAVPDLRGSEPVYPKAAAGLRGQRPQRGVPPLLGAVNE